MKSPKFLCFCNCHRITKHRITKSLQFWAFVILFIAQPAGGRGSRRTLHKIVQNFRALSFFCSTWNENLLWMKMWSKISERFHRSFSIDTTTNNDVRMSNVEETILELLLKRWFDPYSAHHHWVGKEECRVEPTFEQFYVGILRFKKAS